MNDQLKIEKPKLSGLGEADLAAFLKDNPDVFVKRPELLELITLPDKRSTSSLLEKQIDVLRSSLQQQRSTHSELFQVARENEQISDNFSEIVNLLVGFTNLSEFAVELPKALRRIFSIDEVSFKTLQSVEKSSNDKKIYEDANRRLVNQQAMCDNRWPSNIINLFFSAEVKSAALVPMKVPDSDTPLGILALGSKNEERYTHDLGTVHLDKLGFMSGICLSRLQLKLK